MLAQRREIALRTHRENWRREHPISLFPENDVDNDDSDDD